MAINRIKIFLFISFLSTLLQSCSINGGIPEKNNSIAGALWEYSDDDWKYTIKFNEDGTITSTHPNGNMPKCDTWEQKKNKVYFRLSNGFSKYKGKFVNETSIKGKARNKDYKWFWSLSKLPLQ